MFPFPLSRGPSGEDARGQGKLFRPFLCCAAGDDKRRVPEDGVWMLDEFCYFPNGAAVAGLFLCQLSELHSRGSAGTWESWPGKALEGCAKPAGSRVWTSRVQQPVQAFPVVSEPSYESTVCSASPLSSCRPWGGCSGDPPCRCSQVSSVATSVLEWLHLKKPQTFSMGTPYRVPSTPLTPCPLSP